LSKWLRWLGLLIMAVALAGSLAKVYMARSMLSPINQSLQREQTAGFSDQTMIRTAKIAKEADAVNADMWITVAVGVLLFFVGAGIFAFGTSRKNRDATKKGSAKRHRKRSREQPAEPDTAT
jgi:hypothetical protein